MGRKCCIKGCKSVHSSNSEEKIGFYRIPKVVKHQGEQTEGLSKKRNLIWLKCLSLGPEGYSEKMRVCSKHFFSGAPSPLYDTTNPDWIPSKHLIDEDVPEDDSVAFLNFQRYARENKRSTLHRYKLQSPKRRKIQVVGSEALKFDVSDLNFLEDSGVASATLEESVTVNDNNLITNRSLVDFNESDSEQPCDIVGSVVAVKMNFETPIVRKRDLGVQALIKTKVSHFGTQTDSYPEATTQTEAIEVSEKATQILFRSL